VECYLERLSVAMVVTAAEIMAVGIMAAETMAAEEETLAVEISRGCKGLATLESE
jgi:hypothetical protein